MERTTQTTINRRIFLLGAGRTLAAQVAPSRQVGVGIIGAGFRGLSLLQECLNQPSVRIGAVCETYEPRMFGAVALARSKGHQTRYYRIYEDLIADTGLDAVIVATPDFSHHKMTLEALRAGKDVYVEQPLCLSWQQGVELMQAEKQSRQIIQVGSQRRSSAWFSRTQAQIERGGAVRMVQARKTSTYLRPGVLHRGGAKLRDPLNFPDWQAAAAEQLPYNPDRFLNWRFYSMYGGGPVADLGVHVLDGIHLLTGSGFPSVVTATGLRSNEEGFDTAERSNISVEYPNGLTVSLSIDGAAASPLEESTLQGAAGRIAIRRNLDQELQEATRRHLANFFDCVRTRKAPNAPVRATLAATLICQMANLSIQSGHAIRWDADQLRVTAG